MQQAEGGPMAQTVQTNRKKIMVPATMSKSGWAIIEARDDVEGVEFVPTIPKADFHKVLEEASGICLGVQPFSDPELDAAPLLEVVSRIGVGYDAVDVPALTRRKVPLMIGGTSNSVSVAEAGVFLTMSLARKGAMMDTMVKEGRWHDRYQNMPVDLYGKTVLIIGFGKIGTRSARRAVCRRVWEKPAPPPPDASRRWRPTCWSTTRTCTPRRSAVTATSR